MDAQEQLRTRFADHGLVRTSIAVNKVVAEHARPLAPAMLDAARAANALLVTPPSWFGVHIAEGPGLRSLDVYLQPLSSALATRSPGGWANFRITSLLLNVGQRPFRHAEATPRGAGPAADHPVGPGRRPRRPSVDPTCTATAPWSSRLRRTGRRTHAPSGQRNRPARAAPARRTHPADPFPHSC